MTLVERRSGAEGMRAQLLCRATARLRRDRKGVVAILFALLIIPIIGLVGLAIDFAAASQAKATLDLALDAATLQAVTAAVNAVAEDPYASLTPAQATGVQRFMAQAGGLSGIKVQPVSLAVTQQGATFTSTASYTATYPTYFAGLFGVSNMTVAGSSSTVMTSGPYIDIQVLLDVSSSMLIAATPTDIANLTTITASGTYASPASSWWPSGCAFACHWDPNNNDFYAASRANNITLRLDQLTGAISSIIQTVATKNSSSLDRIGLYTFSTSTAMLADLTTDVSTLQQAVKSVGPPLGDPNAPYDTNITEFIYQLASNFVQAAGDGSSPNSPKKFVFILTDGIEDVYSPGRPSNRIELPVDPNACTALKSKGAVVIVLHTLYYEPPGDPFAEIDAIQPAVVSSLMQCASGPNLYFPASDGAQINAAMQQMLSAALSLPARLTQ